VSYQKLAIKYGIIISDIHPYLQAALYLFPKGKLLAMAVINPVSFAGYAYFERGKLLRQMLLMPITI